MLLKSILKRRQQELNAAVPSQRSLPSCVLQVCGSSLQGSCFATVPSNLLKMMYKNGEKMFLVALSATGLVLCDLVPGFH